MGKKVPEYYQYLNWYDLDSPLGLYGFIQEMLNDNLDLNKFPEIKVYYDIMCDNAFRDEPNMITVDYITKKLKNVLIRYNMAHTTSRVDYKLYYYWYEREEEIV